MEYKDTGLPKNQKWEVASAIGYSLMLGAIPNDVQLASAEYKKASVDVINLVKANCDDVSDALITVALLGPAGVVYAVENSDAVEALFEENVMSLVIDLQHRTSGKPEDLMASKSQDAKRIFMATTILHMEGLIIPALESKQMDAGSVAAFSDAMDAILGSIKGQDDKLWNTCNDKLTEVKALLNTNAPTPAPAPKFNPPHR